jgi:hypothetical protein
VGDEAFWDQFWSESVTSVQDVFTLVPSAEIRALREESPSNLATLCYKAVERVARAAESSCRSHDDHVQVILTFCQSFHWKHPSLLTSCVVSLRTSRC